MALRADLLNGHGDRVESAGSVTPPLTVRLALDALKAIGEETRIRIVALLRHSELSVTDLTDILGQSQPRVSRHLKLLVDSGVVEKHREGTWSFFHLAQDGPIAAITSAILDELDTTDADLTADLDRFHIVRTQRSLSAGEYFAQIAPIWDRERSLHASEDTVERTITRLLDLEPYSRLLDMGTGTGRMLQLLGVGEGIERVVGLDSSHSMLSVARANLEHAGLAGAELRQGDVYSPPFPPGSFDLVVIHQVLHYLDDPARAVTEAAQLLQPGGRLLIVDFGSHNHEFLRESQAHRRLGFDDAQVHGWFEHAGLIALDGARLDPPDADRDGLTVALWLGRARDETTSRRPASPTEGEPR